jgi:prepilin-type N-terminal cleavage/methylation domain-containing protein
MKKNKNKIISEKGFTFIEMVVVISLIIILSSVVVANLNPGRTTEQVKAAQDELASAVKLAQSFALQGKMQAGSTPKVYGVKNSGTSGYKIYYCNQVNCPTEGDAESHTFSAGVEIVGSFEFQFDVPHGNVTKGAGTKATIRKGTSPDKWVELNTGGAITKN